MADVPGRPRATLDAALFAAALVIYAAGVPLGLARVESASPTAAGIALDSSPSAGVFGALAIRLAGYLPLGDLGLRANLASAVLGALSVAMFARLCWQMIVLLRRPVTARQDERAFRHEPIAVVAAALALALSLSAFDLATIAGGAAATSALLAAAFVVGLALLRDWASASAGCGLAAMAGLSVGVDPVAGPLLWPLLVGLSVWALRKGARWPLLAPLAFVAAWGAGALASVACSVPPTGLGAVLAPVAHLGTGPRDGVARVALELSDQLGVVGSLLAAIGVVALGVRAAVPVAWLVLTLLSATLFAHRDVLTVGAGRAALPVGLGICVVFSAAGLLHVAGRLGRARLAAAVTLGVMLVITPALDGGAARWRRRASLPMHLLDHALARAEPRSLVDPGTLELEGVFRLGRALGLRPDLVVKPLPPGR